MNLETLFNVFFVSKLKSLRERGILESTQQGEWKIR